MDRTDLMREVQAAARQGGQPLARAVARLDAFDRQQVARHAQQREVDLAARHVTAALTPVPVHEHHTAATDWLGDIEDPRLDYRAAMTAEASCWMHGLPREVLADQHEFTEQALGRARRVASAYGSQAPAAQNAFLSQVAMLSRAMQDGRKLAASGLPQIDQLIDPDNQPSQTPYPTEVFDNFAPEQNQFNTQAENPGGQGWSSEQAPMMQQLNQNNSSGSGFGGGPEKPAEHSTGFDTSDSYAEVPLGAPGQIPASPAPTSTGPGQGPAQPSSAPTPMMGQPQDAANPGQSGPQEDDENRRQASLRAIAYTGPDAHGFRWYVGPLSQEDSLPGPYHMKCGGVHYPDQRCGNGHAHTASVALDYSMTLDSAQRQVAAERTGVNLGIRAVQGARGSLRALASHHNRFIQAWASTDRTMEDTAILHGFQAVVRPVMAGFAAEGSPRICQVCMHDHKAPGFHQSVHDAAAQKLSQVSQSREGSITGSRPNFTGEPR